MYEIRYFDDDRGNEIELPSKIMRFKTESQRILPSDILIDSYKSFKDNIQQAIEDYETFFNTDEYEDRTNEKFSIKIQKFTKLVYLYLDYCEDDCFMYPFIFVKEPTNLNEDKWISMAGQGRILIKWKYFPKSFSDVSYHSMDYGVGSDDVIKEYIDYVKNTKFWKDKDISDKTIRITFENFNNREKIYNIKHLEFAPKEYYNNYRMQRPDYFLENVCDLEISQNIKNLFLNSGIQKDSPASDYIQLLDDFITTSTDIAKRKYTWKLT